MQTEPIKKITNEQDVVIIISYNKTINQYRYQCSLYRKNMENINHSDKEQPCPLFMKNFYVILQLILINAIT